MMKTTTLMVVMLVLATGISYYTGVDLFHIFTTMMLTNVMMTTNKKEE